jgi:hypothetical protein
VPGERRAGAARLDHDHGEAELMTPVSRRAFLVRGLAASATVGVSGMLGSAARAALPSAVAGTATVYPRLLPTGRDLYRDVKRMVDFGQRLPGTDAHANFIDWLDRGFRSAGCKMLPRDQFAFTRWIAERWSLELLEGEGKGLIPVAAYQPYSGNTPPSGVVGELAYLGAVPPLGLSGDPQDVLSLETAIQRVESQLADWAAAAVAGVPGGVAGKIVLVDSQTAPLTEDDFAPLTTYVHDPDRPVGSTPNFKRLALSLIPPASVFAQAGAAGYIVTLDASDAMAAGTYGPYGSAITGLPGLLVGRDTGARLRRYAATNPRTRITLTASVKPSSTDQLVGILPGTGSTDEVIIVNSHTDGMNAFEENGGVGMVWLARYFARLPRARRLQRTLVFSAVSGHFAGPALPQTRGFIDRHPDLVARAAASVTIEHLGASEWLDDARGYHPAGGPDMFVIWHSQSGIAGPVVESMIANDLRHSRALRPAGDYMIAVGTAFNESGVPTVSSIVAPNYMVSWADNGHLAKFMPGRAAREVRWAADLITRLDSIPAAQLAAGDPTVLRTGVACVPGENSPTCLT